MIKRIRNNSLLYGTIVSVIILLVESLIEFEFKLNFSLAFTIGLLTGIINLYISNKSLERIVYNDLTKPRLFYSLVHLIKYIIYGVVLYFSTYLLGFYTAFTCAFGMVFNKIVIYYINLVKVPKEDKNRSVDELDIPNEIIKKLKINNFVKVIDITEVNREKLLSFLSNKEVEIIIKSLKKYELFIKGELEAIIDNDETDDAK